MPGPPSSELSAQGRFRADQADRREASGPILPKHVGEELRQHPLRCHLRARQEDHPVAVAVGGQLLPEFAARVVGQEEELGVAATEIRDQQVHHVGEPTGADGEPGFFSRLALGAGGERFGPFHPASGGDHHAMPRAWSRCSTTSSASSRNTSAAARRRCTNGTAAPSLANALANQDRVCPAANDGASANGR